MNLINNIGIVAISSRLERLSQTFRRDAALIYKKYNADFMNKWYPVIIALNSNSPLSLAELAAELSYAHPSIVELINEMEAQKLIKSSVDKNDGRKRMISLTAKGKETLKSIKPFYDAFEKVLTKITDNQNNLLNAIEEVEAKLRQESFFKRVNKLMNTKIK